MDKFIFKNKNIYIQSVVLCLWQALQLLPLCGESGLQF
jgi:hypothetical protein